MKHMTKPLWIRLVRLALRGVLAEDLIALLADLAWLG